MKQVERTERRLKEELEAKRKASEVQEKRTKEEAEKYARAKQRKKEEEERNGRQELQTRIKWR